MSGIIARGIAVIALVAALAFLMTQADPTGPQLLGWTELRGALSLSSFTAFQGNWAGQTACGGYDVGCWISNLVHLFVGFLWNLAVLIVWVLGTLFAIAIAIFGAATLTFSPPLPLEVQALLWAFTVPLLVIIILKVITTVRGTEG